MKREVLKAVARIVSAIICGIAIGYLAKLNMEAGLPMPAVIGIAAGMIILVS